MEGERGGSGGEPEAPRRGVCSTFVARRRAHARRRSGGVLTLVALERERYKEPNARMWNVYAVVAPVRAIEDRLAWAETCRRATRDELHGGGA